MAKEFSNIQEKEKELKGQLAQAKKEKRRGLLKVIGRAAIPLVGMTGIGVGLNYTIENLDTVALSATVIGFTIGMSGILYNSIEHMKDGVDNMKYFSSKIKEYRTQLSSLR